MTAYYNEFDPNAAAWLRELVNRGLIAPGDVDDRSILDVRLDDLKGYTQCHFFAGIGVWSYALRRAGWPDDRPVWTGSCPCPPFSSAGKGQTCPDCGSKRNLCHPRRTGYFICLDCGCSRHADERHLWPEFSRLVRERRPPVVFGEQVASADGRLWLDAVSADLRLASYGVAGADLCAAGVGAPHIRQRLWWVAERLANTNHGGEHALLRGEQDNPAEDFWRRAADGLVGQLAGGNESELGRLADTDRRKCRGLPEFQGAVGDGENSRWAKGGGKPSACRDDGRLADTDNAGLEGRREPGCERAAKRLAGACGMVGGLAYAEGAGRREQRPYAERRRERSGAEGLEQRSERSGMLADQRPGPVNGLWRAADWLFCRDGKWRPVEPGTSPLAHGAPARMGRLRGYGNAINSEAAKVFIEAYLETEAGRHLQLTPETDIFS